MKARLRIANNVDITRLFSASYRGGVRGYGDMSDLKEMGCPSAQRKWIYDNTERVKHAYTDWYLSEIMHVSFTYEDYKGKLLLKIKDREEELRQYLLDAFKASGLKSQREVGIRLGTNMERHYFGRSQWEFPTAEMYAKMQTFMPLPRPYGTLFGIDGGRIGADIRSLVALERLTSFYSLESYSNIKRLRGLKGLKGLRFFSGAYDEVDIAKNAIIYCDIPYKGTAQYEDVEQFDHERFYDWALHQKELVVISEYDMPETDFIPVAATKLFAQLQGGSGKETTEKLFIPRHQWDLYKKRSGRLF